MQPTWSQLRGRWGPATGSQGSAVATRVSARSLTAGRLRPQQGTVVTATVAPPLPADLEAGLKRFKMAAMRRLAPELLVTAKSAFVRVVGFGSFVIECGPDSLRALNRCPLGSGVCSSGGLATGSVGARAGAAAVARPMAEPAGF
jgi:hypothetical protein